MFQKDWIMRMTQQIAQVIAKVVFNKEQHHYQESHELTNTALRQYFTLSRDLVLSLSADDCLQLANGFGELRSEVVLTLVDLLVIDADVFTMEGRSDVATVIYEKSLAFLDRLQISGDQELQHAVESKLSLIRSKLLPS